MSEMKELALKTAKGLVERGDGDTLMPEGTWGMRKPMAAHRLVALAERMAARQVVPTPAALLTVAPETRAMYKGGVGG